MNQLQAFEKQTLEALPTYGKIPTFRAGDTLRVHVRITEGAKERTQAFEGVCIARKNRGIGSSFRVRRLLAGQWVERQFSLYSPLIRIECLRQGRVRRAKLYYLRGRQGKAARIKERTFYGKKAALAAKAAKATSATASKTEALAADAKTATPTTGG